jgi:hypothetical protein
MQFPQITKLAVFSMVIVMKSKKVIFLMHKNSLELLDEIKANALSQVKVHFSCLLYKWGEINCVM